MPSRRALLLGGVCWLAAWLIWYGYVQTLRGAVAGMLILLGLVCWLSAFEGRGGGASQ